MSVEAEPVVPKEKPDPLKDPAVELAIMRTRAETAERIASTQTRTPDLPVAQPGVTIPDNPLDLLNAEQKQALSDLSMDLSRRGEYDRFMADLSSRHAQMKMGQAAQPLIARQADTIIRFFKAERRTIDQGRFERIEPLFDADLRTANVGALVNMPDAQATGELMRYWMAAKARDIEKNPDAPPRREATLVSTEGNNAPPPARTGPLPTDIEAMKKSYNLTDEQVAVIMDDRFDHIAQAGF